MKITIILADVMKTEEMTDEMSAQIIVVTDVTRAEGKKDARKGVRKDGKRGARRDVRIVADGIPMTVTHMDREPLPGKY